MNRRTMLLVLIFAIVLFFATNVHAKNYKMIFWYPGEAGSSADAQPLLDDLSKYINEKFTGNTITGKYVNSTQEGLSFIKSQKPDLGILSYIAFKENESSLPKTTKIASTLPLPAGVASEEFVIVGAKKWDTAAKIEIISSLPMSANFLRTNLAPDIKGEVTVTGTKAMLSDLKKISSGELKDRFAILTPMERFTVDNMKGDWKANIQTVYKCKPISSAPVVMFGEKDPAADKLAQILTQMKDDPKAKEILESLRLKGFQ